MVFDTSKLMEQVERQAGEHVLTASEKARRSLGSDAASVTVKKLSPPRRNGSNITYAEYTFPNDDVKQRFFAALRREMA